MSQIAKDVVVVLLVVIVGGAVGGLFFLAYTDKIDASQLSNTFLTVVSSISGAAVAWVLRGQNVSAEIQERTGALKAENARLATMNTELVAQVVTAMPSGNVASGSQLPHSYPPPPPRVQAKES